MKIVVFKKKTIIAIVACLAFIGVAIGGGFGIAAFSPKAEFMVVIDPGHGGIDNGVVGKNGTKESEFNLEMSFLLRDFLKGAGFKVVLTRKDGEGLYGDVDSDFKRADMRKRKEIIEKNDPDFVISIHANKFPGDDRRGAQAFFNDMSKDGERLAVAIQAGLNDLNNKYVGRSFSALAGEYYMLNCTLKPSVIVECGFLSNEEDEKLLNDPDYREKLAFAIYSGLCGYLSDA